MEPSGSGTDMFGAAPKESEGGAAHNMSREEVVTSRLCHWRKLIRSKERPKGDEEVLVRRAADIIEHCERAGLNIDLIHRMLKDDSAPPWTEDMLPSWKDIVRSMPFEDQAVISRSADIVEQKLRRW